MRTQDGVELLAPASDPAAVVRELHKMSLSPCRTDAEFMRQMAARAAEKVGKCVSAATPAEFVRSMLALGILLDD